jgi:hypothetical protein
MSPRRAVSTAPGAPLVKAGRCSWCKVLLSSKRHDLPFETELAMQAADYEARNR